MHPHRPPARARQHTGRPPAPHSGRRPNRSRRPGWLLLAVAVSAILAGMRTGHGFVLAAGLALGPVALHLISGGGTVADRGERSPCRP
ncbi:hypothetical protein ABNF97_28615 [Plantactinospora sp. B6F1]|uniref:hypothetical protein n=1 Tax=Plantactinospora sp. B6F1 TaxID=3158971 RepID=UPI00102BB04D